MSSISCSGLIRLQVQKVLNGASLNYSVMLLAIYGWLALTQGCIIYKIILGNFLELQVLCVECSLSFIFAYFITIIPPQLR